MSLQKQPISNAMFIQYFSYYQKKAFRLMEVKVYALSEYIKQNVADVPLRNSTKLDKVMFRLIKQYYNEVHKRDCTFTWSTWFKPR